MSSRQEPGFTVSVRGNTTTYTAVKPEVAPRRTSEFEPEHFFPRRRLYTGKPPFDTPEARRNHQLRREYVLFWALRDRGFDMPFPEHLHDVTCGAKTRAGTLCKQRALYANARCKFHGGLSTGPTSVEGKRRSSENGKQPKKLGTSTVSASKAHDAQVNVDLSAPVAHSLRTDPSRQPGDSEAYGDPMTPPTSQDSCEQSAEREAQEELTKLNIAPPQKPAEEPKKTLVPQQPSNNADTLAGWMAV